MINKLLVEDEKAEKKEAKRKRQPIDATVKILLFQSGLVAVLLIIVLVIKSFFVGSFEELKNVYEENLGVDTNINTVIEGGVGGPADVVPTLSKGVGVNFQSPVKGSLTSRYGIRIDPFTGKRAFHSGVDIGAASGEKIVAVAGGAVIKKAYLADYGNYVIVNHGSFSTLYAHCSSISVDEGAMVEQGQLIARVGSTGRSTGPHLHFEIRIGDSRIDPLPFLDFGEN